MTEAGEAIGDRVQSATAATAAAAGPKSSSGYYRNYRDGGRSGEKRAGRRGQSSTGSLVASGRSGGGRRGCGSSRDQIGFAADRREAVDRSSGRLRARLRRGFVDSRMARRPIRAIGRALGRRGRTYTTANVMRRWCIRIAASVPIVCERNAGRSTIGSCTPIASRASSRCSPMPDRCHRHWRRVWRPLENRPTAPARYRR